MRKWLLLAECKSRHVYRVFSRNLQLAVFNGTDGFVGVRTKFGEEYLFTEYHVDCGPPFGTVAPMEDLGPLPESLPVCEASGDLLAWLLAFGG